MDITQINWADPKAMVSKHFSVHECTFLPSWGIYHIPSDIEKANILKHALVMDQVRDFLDNACNINVWIRPTSVNAPTTKFHGKNYNQLIGGAANSAHIEGLACDFTVSRITCDDVRFLLESELEILKLRMENKPGASWVHLDSRDLLPGGKRFFKP